MRRTAEVVLQIGSLLWAVIPEDPKGEARPCMVTACSPYRQHQHVVEVVYGQDHPPQHVISGTVQPYKVEKTSALGRALGLSKTTYFCTVTNVYLNTITKRCKDPCPELDQPELEEIAEKLRG